MTITEVFSQYVYNEAESNLITEILDFTNSFYQTITAYTDIDDRLLEHKLFNLRYTDFDNRFKSLYNINPRSKYHSLYPRSYANFNLSKALELYNFNKTGREFSYSKRRHMFIKYKFDTDLLNCILNYTLAFVIKTSPKASVAQFYLSYTLALMEFFYASDIDWVKSSEYFNDFMTNVDIKDFSKNVHHLTESQKEIVRKRAESNTGKKHKKKHNRRKKTDIPDEEILEVLKENNHKNTKKIIAEKYNISEITVQRRMKELNLTRQYKTTKTI